MRDLGQSMRDSIPETPQEQIRKEPPAAPPPLKNTRKIMKKPISKE